MKMTDLPSAVRESIMSNRPSTSMSVRTAVGSSRMRELGAAVEDLQDLNALLHADGHLGDFLIEVNLQAIAVRKLLDLLLVSRSVELGARALGSQDDVLQAGHGLDQHEVLVHHANAQGHRIGGALDPHLFATIENLAIRGLVEAHEDVHERGLARSVLAQQGVDLSLANREVHVLVGVFGTEALADVLHPQQFCHVIPLLFAGRANIASSNRT